MAKGKAKVVNKKEDVPALSDDDEEAGPLAIDGSEPDEPDCDEQEDE